MKRRLVRRLIALAAAYTVVLNAWLPAIAGILTPQAGGEPSAAVICAAGPGAFAPASGLPQKHSPLCPWNGACDMPGCTPSALCDTDSIAPATPHAVEARIEKALAGSYGAGPWRAGSKLARGPPVA